MSAEASDDESDEASRMQRDGMSSDASDDEVPLKRASVRHLLAGRGSGADTGTARKALGASTHNSCSPGVSPSERPTEGQEITAGIPPAAVGTVASREASHDESSLEESSRTQRSGMPDASSFDESDESSRAQRSGKLLSSLNG